MTKPSPATASRRPRASSQARIRQILASARELLAEQGAATLSVYAVAEHAGIPPSSVYHFFSGVPALLAAQPNAQVLIVGGDSVSYGAPAPAGQHLRTDLGARRPLGTARSSRLAVACCSVPGRRTRAARLRPSLSRSISNDSNSPTAGKHPSRGKVDTWTNISWSLCSANTKPKPRSAFHFLS